RRAELGQELIEVDRQLAREGARRARRGGGLRDRLLDASAQAGRRLRRRRRRDLGRRGGGLRRRRRRRGRGGRGHVVSVRGRRGGALLLETGGRVVGDRLVGMERPGALEEQRLALRPLG